MKKRREGRVEERIGGREGDDKKEKGKVEARS